MTDKFEWIKYSEVEPEDEQEILITFESPSGYRDVISATYDKEYHDFLDDTGASLMDLFVDSVVIAWAPMPGPYRG